MGNDAMNPILRARVAFCCNGNVVCSVGADRAVNVPLSYFDFSPVPGQEIDIAFRAPSEPFSVRPRHDVAASRS